MAVDSSINLGDNEDLTIEAIKKLPLERRSAWLDNLIKVELQRVATKSDIDKMFDKVRSLQVQLGLRYDFDEGPAAWFLDKSRPFVSHVQDTNEEVLPGSFSQSRKHLTFKLNLFNDIKRKYQPKLNIHGHPDASAYGHDVSRLLSVTGMIPRNIGVRPLDNRSLRINQGLSNQMPDDLLKMMDDFLNLMYGKVKPTRVRIESKSQSGLPLRQYGRGYKTLAFMHAVNHLSDVIKLTDNCNLKELFLKYDILYAYLMGSRRQPDAGGKRRYITTESDRLLGNTAMTLVDNSVEITGVPEALTRHFARMRFRMVYGGNIIANTIMNCIASSARTLYGDTFNFTLKHHGGDDIMAKIKSFASNNNFSRDIFRGVGEEDISIVAIDVTQFDGSYPSELLMKYADYFKDTAIYNCFLRQMLGVSVQLLRDADSESVPDLTGDPFDFDPLTFKDSGMPSGWSWVSDTGKIMCLAIYYSLVKSKLLEKHTPVQLYRFLKGELNYALLNLGDDNVILGPPNKHDSILKALEEYCPWKCEIEQGTRFIGHIISVDDFGYYQVSHDPSSYITNLLTPERGIRSSFRKYWAVGYQERKKVYLDAPITVNFSRMLQDAWFKVYNSNLEEIINKKADEQRLMMSTSNDDESRILNSLLNAIPNAPDRSFAEHVLMRYIADSSVLSWEFSREDILSKVGIDLFDLESRPPIEYTLEVLSNSGYDVSNFDIDDDNVATVINKKLQDKLINDPEWFFLKDL